MEAMTPLMRCVHDGGGGMMANNHLEATTKNLRKFGSDLHKKIASIDRHIDYDLRSLGSHSWDSRLTSVSIYTHASLKKLDSDIGNMVDEIISQVNDYRGEKE